MNQFGNGGKIPCHNMRFTVVNLKRVPISTEPDPNHQQVNVIARIERHRGSSIAALQPSRTLSDQPHDSLTRPRTLCSCKNRLQPIHENGIELRVGIHVLILNLPRLLPFPSGGRSSTEEMVPLA